MGTLYLETGMQAAPRWISVNKRKKPVQGNTNSPFNPTTGTIDSKMDEVSDEAA